MFNNENNHHRLGFPHGSWWWQEYLFWRWQPGTESAGYMQSLTPELHKPHLSIFKFQCSFCPFIEALRGIAQIAWCEALTELARSPVPQARRNESEMDASAGAATLSSSRLCTVRRGCERPLSNQPSGGQLGRFSPITNDHPGLLPSWISETTCSCYNLILNNCWEDLYGPLSNIEHLVRVLSVPLSDLNGLNRKLQGCCKHHKVVPPTLCRSPFFGGWERWLELIYLLGTLIILNRKRSLLFQTLAVSGN